jgi:aconitate hydratase
MPGTVAEQLIEDHLVEGETTPGEEIGIEIDQTLTQDATGTLVMLELEAMDIPYVRTDASVQYVDHNLIQEDHKNPDDHLFLKTASERFGVHFSRPGNGVSHPVHQARFGVPGKTLVGSDSHTPAAGALGMLAIGSGGMDVASAMAGEPYYVTMPEVWGVELTGELPDWVSAKDVILEMLRRHDVDGAVNQIIEYHGPGLDDLNCMDRHVIANMGTELGATSTVFPADETVQRYLARERRPDDFRAIQADDDVEYHETEHIDLSDLEPLVAKPSSPGNVVPVREIEGKDIYQSYIGSSANPGLRDFWVPSRIVSGRTTPEDVSLDVNPTSRQLLQNLTATGALNDFYACGARIHQAGCNGCIGMGQAPASGERSLRTVPRNFPDRSGTEDDMVYLVSPETAAASALRGEITDPRDLASEMEYPDFSYPDDYIVNDQLVDAPPPKGEAVDVELRKGPNVKSLPDHHPLESDMEVPVLLKVGDDVSTDAIMPAGNDILPYRSNVPKISEFVFHVVDDTYYDRAMKQRDQGGHVIVGGSNYGQGSSREHAAVAPMYLGVKAKLAKSYARIHWQNLVNFGILPLEFTSEADYEAVDQGDVLELEDVRQQVQDGPEVEVRNATKGETFTAVHSLSERQVETLLVGGLIVRLREKHGR